VVQLVYKGDGKPATIEVHCTVCGALLRFVEGDDEVEVRAHVVATMEGVLIVDTFALRCLACRSCIEVLRPETRRQG